MSYTSLSIAEYIVSNQFKMIWCSSIIAFAIIGLSRIFLATFKVKSQLKAAKKSINAIEDNQTAELKINSFQQEFTKHNKLYTEWQNCKAETTTDSSLPNKIFCPNTIDHYFNEDQLDNQLIPRIVHAPNETQLTTLGVVGTFVGLASGVFLAKEGFQKNDMSELQLALSQLLSGASLAFLTAITGIVCALIFGKIRLSLLNSLQQNLLLFQNTLKRHFQTFDIAKILQNQLVLQQSQQNVFSEMLKELKAQKNSKELLGEKILSQLINEFRDVLTSGASKQLGQLSQDFLAASNTLKQCATDMKENSQVIIQSGESSLKIIENGLKNAAMTFDNELKIAVLSISKVAKEVSADVGSGILEAGLFTAEQLKAPAKELADAVRDLCESSKQASEDWTDALLCTEKIADHLVKTQECLREMSPLPPIMRDRGVNC